MSQRSRGAESKANPAARTKKSSAAASSASIGSASRRAKPAAAARSKAPPVYFCYLLQSVNPDFPRSTYIGFTTDPRRRIRQHNGEIGNGAVKTARRRPWEMCCCVWGFPDKHSALKFEWAFQNPKQSRAVRGVLPGHRFEAGLLGKLQLMHLMLGASPWCNYPLHVRWVSPRFFGLRARLGVQVPAHMDTTAGPLTSLPCYSSAAAASYNGSAFVAGDGEDDYDQDGGETGDYDDADGEADCNDVADGIGVGGQGARRSRAAPRKQHKSSSAAAVDERDRRELQAELLDFSGELDDDGFADDAEDDGAGEYDVDLRDELEDDDNYAENGVGFAGEHSFLELASDWQLSPVRSTAQRQRQRTAARAAGSRQASVSASISAAADVRDHGEGGGNVPISSSSSLYAMGKDSSRWSQRSRDDTDSQDDFWMAPTQDPALDDSKIDDGDEVLDLAFGLPDDEEEKELQDNDDDDCLLWDAAGGVGSSSLSSSSSGSASMIRRQKSGSSSRSILGRSSSTSSSGIASSSASSSSSSTASSHRHLQSHTGLTADDPGSPTDDPNCCWLCKASPQRQLAEWYRMNGRSFTADNREHNNNGNDSNADNRDSKGPNDATNANNANDDSILEEPVPGEKKRKRATAAASKKTKANSNNSNNSNHYEPAPLRWIAYGCVACRASVHVLCLARWFLHGGVSPSSASSSASSSLTSSASSLSSSSISTPSSASLQQLLPRLGPNPHPEGASHAAILQQPAAEAEPRSSSGNSSIASNRSAPKRLIPSHGSCPRCNVALHWSAVCGQIQLRERLPYTPMKPQARGGRASGASSSSSSSSSSSTAAPLRQPAFDGDFASIGSNNFHEQQQQNPLQVEHDQLPQPRFTKSLDAIRGFQPFSFSPLQRRISQESRAAAAVAPAMKRKRTKAAAKDAVNEADEKEPVPGDNGDVIGGDAVADAIQDPLADDTNPKPAKKARAPRKKVASAAAAVSDALDDPLAEPAAAPPKKPRKATTKSTAATRRAKTAAASVEAVQEVDSDAQVLGEDEPAAKRCRKAVSAASSSKSLKPPPARTSRRPKMAGVPLFDDQDAPAFDSSAVGDVAILDAIPGSRHEPAIAFGGELDRVDVEHEFEGEDDSLDLSQISPVRNPGSLDRVHGDRGAHVDHRDGRDDSFVLDLGDEGVNAFVGGVGHSSRNNHLLGDHGGPRFEPIDHNHKHRINDHSSNGDGFASQSHADVIEVVDLASSEDENEDEDDEDAIRNLPLRERLLLRRRL